MEIDPKKTPDELAEEAFAMISVAMFRSGKQTGSYREAVMIGETFMSALSGTLMDFRRNLAKETSK